MKPTHKKNSPHSIPRHSAKCSFLPGADWPSTNHAPESIAKLSDKAKGDLALQIVRDMAELEHRQRDYNKAMRSQLRVLKKNLHSLAQGRAE